MGIGAEIKMTPEEYIVERVKYLEKLVEEYTNSLEIANQSKFDSNKKLIDARCRLTELENEVNALLKKNSRELETYEEEPTFELKNTIIRENNFPLLHEFCRDLHKKSTEGK